MELTITINDERFGTETEHTLVAEIHTTPGEPATRDCPGCDAEWEVIKLCVEGESQDISQYLSEEEWTKVNDAVSSSLSTRT